MATKPLCKLCGDGSRHWPGDCPNAYHEPEASSPSLEAVKRVKSRTDKKPLGDPPQVVDGSVQLPTGSGESPDPYRRQREWAKRNPERVRAANRERQRRRRERHGNV